MNKMENQKNKKGGLGKGLDSLLGVQTDENLGNNQLVLVSPNQITPNPKQPRKSFDEQELENLAQSIREDGIVQPLVTYRDDMNDRYIIIAGERRWRASKLAGLEKVPILIKDVSPDEVLRIAIIENVQRSDLNVIEEAEAYAALIKELGLTQEECARQVGKDRSTIANLLRILTLPSVVQKSLENEVLTMGHGRALLGLPDPESIIKAHAIVLKNKLSVRQTELLVKKIKEPTGVVGAQANPDLEYLADMLRGHLRTKVSLSGNGSRGRIEISYFSASELERILEIIGTSNF
ncbi:MAG: ParB/RepB/Spo0J family partition protein [Pseudobacteriovorax sp.]|nr:ParB/RepB/Spo0J family partition protein [Pseudobacteriovorax sp.]